MRRKPFKNRNRIIIISLIIFFIFLFGGYIRLINYYLQVTRLRNEISVIKAENEVLKLRVARYQENKQIVERFARDRLGMKRPYESVILIINDDK